MKDPADEYLSFYRRKAAHLQEKIKGLAGAELAFWSKVLEHTIQRIEREQPGRVSRKANPEQTSQRFRIAGPELRGLQTNHGGGVRDAGCSCLAEE